MAPPDADLVSAVSERATPLPEPADLTPSDLPDALRSQLEEAAVVGLGESSHGTSEFHEVRFALIRLLVAEYGVRAVAFEAGFDPMCRVDDPVVAGEGDVRRLAAEELAYRPFRTTEMVEVFEWLQSFNAARPPEDRVHVYGFDTTGIECAANEIEAYLDRVDADIDDPIREDLAVMTDGHDDPTEPGPVLEAARRVRSTLVALLEANESTWVAATSRRAYEHVRHRLHLVDVQLDAHDRDLAGRLALRDEMMATHAEWVHELSTGPVVVWGHNGHLSRGANVLEEWDVEHRAMGDYLASWYGEDYCPIGLETATGTVAALDGSTDEPETYDIPDPPAESVPAVFAAVDAPRFCVRVDDLHESPTVQRWLRTEPEVHNIWGGRPEGDNPVHYWDSDLTEHDFVIFIEETSALSHLY